MPEKKILDFPVTDVVKRPVEERINGDSKRYNFKSVAVFIGSSKGTYPGTQKQDPIYEEDAKLLGASIAKAGWRLVYGGGNAALMGILSQAVLENGGSILGVLSEAFVQADSNYIQRTHPNAQEVIVKKIEDRKWKMITSVDAFLVGPGGLGTLDELADAGVEQYQRPYKGKPTVSKPIVVLNTKGIYDHTRAQFAEMVDRGFASPIIHKLYRFVDTVEEGLKYLENLQGQPRLGLEEIGNVEKITKFANNQHVLKK